MSQRNPMNQRYTQENREGSTRKSASSLKPKSKAAASVTISSGEKTPQEKKAAKRKQRAEEAEIRSLYYNPPTPEYRKMRKIWFVLIMVAVSLTVIGSILSWRGISDQYSWVIIIVAYAFIIAAIWIDIVKIRKIREAYRQKMVAKYGSKAHDVVRQQLEAQMAAKREKKGGKDISSDTNKPNNEHVATEEE
ncbi:MAG: hypothetical protein IJV62_00025 [Eggerthellaceae bacterium]|nr:hypothetical protein [Eggerthellaceae bacterium]